MKNKINLLLITLVSVFGISLTSCSDDEGGVATAVLGTTDNLEFPVTEAVPAIITIASDGAWHVETPDWITVTPSSGPAGTTDVTVQVADNERDGIADLPRKYTLNFMGDKKMSIFALTVRQEGDKFRDIQPSAIADIDAMEEESAIQLKNLPVLAQTKKGFVGTDGRDFVYVTGDAAQARTGQLIDMLGTKAVNSAGLTEVKCDQLTDVKSGSIPDVTPVDITDNIDSYKAAKRTLIKATGIYDGTKLVISGKKMGVSVVDNAVDCDMSRYAGHILTITGIYSGTASPVVNVIATSVEDLGLNEIIYCMTDFDNWWADFASWSGSGSNEGKEIDCIGCDNVNNYLPNLTTPKVNGVSPMDILKEKGWSIQGSSTFQKMYIRLGATDKQGCITTPKMPELGDGTEGVKVSFDWCPWRDKAPAEGKAYDPVQLVVVVDKDGVETQFPVPVLDLAAGASLKWYTVEVDLKGVSLDKNTKITIRPIDDQCMPKYANKGLFRFFINKIKVFKPGN